MELGHLEVAVLRGPIAVVRPRVGSEIDPAVVHLEELAVGVEGHAARVGVGGAGVGRAAPGQPHVVDMGQVAPLLAGRLRGDAAEQAAGPVGGPDGVSQVGPDGVDQVARLAVAADVDDGGIGRVGRQREVGVAPGLLGGCPASPGR